MMRRKVKQLFAAGMALAVLATNLTPLSFAAEQPDAEPAAAASGDMYDANAILDFAWDWEYIGCSWSSDYATATFNYRVEKNGHEKSVTVNSEKHEKSPTCTEGGKTVYTATVLGAPDALIRTETETVEVPKLEHNYPVKPKSIRFDGLSDLGYEPTAVAIYECTRCGQTKTEEVTDLTYVELKKATCVEKGEGYWVASAGGRTEESALVHPGTTDHDFTKKDAAHVTFDFAEDGKTAVATIQCAHCDATTTENVTCTAEVTTPATCTKMGTTTYTATCGTASETTTRQDVAMADHEYSASVEWVGTDFMKGRVTYECTQCGPDDEGHFKYEDVDAVVKVVKEPTCLKDGVERHLISASINGVEVATMVEDIKLPALGHSYDNSCDVRWDDSTYKTATLTWECDNEGCDVNSEGHFKSETLTAVEKVTKPATCTDTGKLLHEVSYEFGGETEYLSETTIIPALGHACSLELKWDDDTCTSATATVKCSDCDYERDVPVTITAVRTEPTCTEIGYIDYTATADVTYDSKTEGRSPEKDSAQIYGQIELPALGHSFTNYVYNGDATCGGDGTETAKCDRCDVTDTRTAVATAGCDLHTVDGAKVCAVCGKVNGQPKLAAAEANADVNASTIGVHLVVRVGTLPTGQKVITVAFLNNDGQAVRMFGTQKIHVSLAQLKAALGDTEGTGFEHTLTRVNTANGEKQNVGFTVENGTVNFDAAFNGSTACILLVD